VSIELAADVIQDFIGDFLGISEFESEAHFPEEMKKLNDEILDKISESN